METLVAQGLALVQGEPYVADALLIDMVSEQTTVAIAVRCRLRPRLDK